jgi:hypothetical protein
VKTTIQQHCNKSPRAIRQSLLVAAGTVSSWLRIEESILAYGHSELARASTRKGDVVNASFNAGVVALYPPGSPRIAA